MGQLVMLEVLQCDGPGKDRSMGEGWGTVVCGCGAHYFINGKSLCGEWLWVRGNLEPVGETAPDDCVLCTRRLEKHQVSIKEGYDGKSSGQESTGYRCSIA